MRAVALLVERRPNCHVVVLGGDDVSYGSRLPGGESYRQRLSAELGLACERVHFLGQVRYDIFLRVLKVSSVHVYLTVPFVLSWSVLEAMATGCLVVASQTPPVTEVIREGENGLLVDFLDHRALAERIGEALDHPERFAPLRERARRTVVERFNLARCLSLQLALIRTLAGRRLPRPAGAAPDPARLAS
jgi:glycosyltransferase involved in cell wall biosynthesis